MDGWSRINRQSPDGRAADERDDLERKPLGTGKLSQECDDRVDDGGTLVLNMREDAVTRQMLGARMDDHKHALKEPG